MGNNNFSQSLIVKKNQNFCLLIIQVKLDKYPKTKFCVKYDFAEDGKFKSMHIPTEFHQGEWEGAKMGPVARNLWKGFANLLQINYGKHEKQGLKAYKAWEVRLNYI